MSCFNGERGIFMVEIVLNKSDLQEQLIRLIQTDKVKLIEIDGEIRLTPVFSSPLRKRDLLSSIEIDLHDWKWNREEANER